MAQFSTSRNRFLGNNEDLYEVVMIAGQSGPSVYVPKGNLNTSSDAFGRLRVSEPFTLFDNSFRYSDSPEKWAQKVTGTASSAHNADEGLIELTVGTSSGDEIIRETSKVFQYQPGKSLLTLNTFVMGEAQENLRMRVGYFGKENGVYFERDGSDLYIVKRSAVSGSVVETRIPQSEWNGDRLDGTDESNVNLDSTKAQIFWSDFEWLGVGSVRCGFVINGQYILSHVFHHANQIDTTYMTTATLPLRYEITNTGTTTGATLKQICSTVISEGGYTALNISRSASTALVGKATSDSDYTPLISIRLKGGRTDAVVIPSEIAVYGLSQAAYEYALIKGAALDSADWTPLDSSSSVEYDVVAPSMTGGTIVKTGFFVGDNKGGVNAESLLDLNKSLQLGRGVIESDSAGGVFTLAARATTNNDLAVGTMTWQEHT
jgi:hypothetical protein